MAPRELAHRGAVLLQRSFGEEYLLHQLTGELIWLEGAGHSLRFSPQGQGELVLQDGVVVPLDTKFLWMVRRRDDGSFELQHRETHAVHDLMQRLKQFVIKWPRCEFLSKQVKVHVFVQPRSGARSYWEFRQWQASVSAAAKEDLIVHQHAKWMAWVHRALTVGVPMVHWRRAKSEEEGSNFDDIPGFRCLREASCSSWALVWWLLFHAARARSQAKDKSSNVLENLIDLVMLGQFELELAMSYDARDRASVQSIIVALINQ